MGELTPALLEGVTFGFADSIALLNEMRIPINEIRVIGGGSKSDLWLEILTDILEKSIYRINTDQGSALGAAILASVGSNHFSDVKIACERLVKTTEHSPPPIE